MRGAILTALLAFLGGSVALADQVASTVFKGLNNNESSVIIGPEFASDLLNVDVTAGGKSVKKRQGYGLYKDLGTDQPVRGGFHSFDASGNDVQIWGSSTSLYGIVADGTPTQLVSSATLNSTWDCTDTQGYSYCVNSSRNAFIRTDGATITWYTSPLGTMVESTPDRVVVAGVSGAPNTLYVSQSNTFTNYTTGVNETDAFTEVIASPGSHLTHIRWGCGKLLWWKDASFGYFDFDNQYTAQVNTVSDTIGTFDNTSAIDPGGQVWFRGQDGHTWKYDCSSLSKESIDITPLVQASSKRTSNHWTQTSGTEFDDGSISLSGSLNYGAGSDVITVASFTATDTSDAHFNAGTLSSITVTGNTFRLSWNNLQSVTNNGFESGTGTAPDSWTAVYAGRDDDLDGTQGCSGALTGKSGTYYGDFAYQVNTYSPRLVVSLVDSHTSATLQSQTYQMTAQNCAFTDQTFSVSSSHYGKSAYLKFLETDDLGSSTDGSLQTSSSFVVGGDVTFAMAISVGTNYRTAPIDNIRYGFSSISSGSFTSQSFDTNLTHSYVQLTADWTVNTSTPSFVLQKSSSATGQWASVLTSTGSSAAVDQRYVRYLSTVTVGSAESALTAINDVTILARSTGTYYSVVHNAPNIVSWDTFSANQTLNDGTLTYYTRASTNAYTTLSSTPAWVAQTNGGTVASSTGTYIQTKIDFGITSATQTPTVNDFTFNWFEGSATDQAYMIYFDNAIWQSVTYGAGESANNYIFKYDLINEGWTLYNIGTGGMLVQNNTLYFGSPTTDNTFRYGTLYSDNGTAINAYWKTKTFTGADPFLQNNLTNIDTFAKKDAGSTLTATYQTDTLTSTSYSLSLSTGAAIIQNRKLLPSGKSGYGFSIQYGDTSDSSAWELFGFRLGYTVQPYRPTQ